MTTGLPPVIISRLEKAAVDNGFDIELPPDGSWLGFASTQCPLRLWITSWGEGSLFIALSQKRVADALLKEGAESVPLPKGAVTCVRAATIPEMHHLVRRTFHLSKALPDELLHLFERQTAALPKSTEAERLVVQRVGQDVFRNGLLDYWDGRCAITGLAAPQLLRASHIKPWAECASDSERLDVFNGLLLVASLDAAFDSGLITVADSGDIVVSSLLSPTDRALVGLDQPQRVNALADGHRAYLPWHRERVFRGER